MTKAADRIRTVIMGAAGRDFHNFNVLYRDDPAYEVVAFTAAQIPGIGGRRYPPALAGPHYPDGIPIRDEAELDSICHQFGVGRVVFAYSDVPHAVVMHAASRAIAAGADFVLHGPDATMLRSRLPVIAVTAIRTGCGKSQTSRWISRYLRDRGLKVGVLRHPMPYGDLESHAVQRFAAAADLDTEGCTNEEREEYEPYIAAGGVIFAGVDYAAILAKAEAEADLILWDGGNNDFSFLRPDLHIVLADAMRPGQATTHHPGEAVLRMADVIIVNKVDAAPPGNADLVATEVGAINPRAALLRAASPARLSDPDAVQGKRVVVVEDGPTITHGGLPHGAGLSAARQGGAAQIVDPRPWAPPAIRAVYDAYPHIGPVLPAVGYDDAQLRGLKQTLDAAEADVVVVGTPFDLAGRIALEKPAVRVSYEYADAGEPRLADIVDEFLSEKGFD